MYLPLQYIVLNIVTALKTLCALPTYPSPPLTLEVTGLLTISTVSPPRMPYTCIIHYIWLLSLNNLYLICVDVSFQSFRYSKNTFNTESFQLLQKCNIQSWFEYTLFLPKVSCFNKKFVKRSCLEYQYLTCMCKKCWKLKKKIPL